LSRKGKGKDLGGSTTGEPSGANGDGQYSASLLLLTSTSLIAIVGAHSHSSHSPTYSMFPQCSAGDLADTSAMAHTDDRTAPQKRPMLGPSRSSSPSTLQTTRTIRLQSGDDSPFIRPRTPTPPPSSRSMMMPQRPSMDAIKDFGSVSRLCVVSFHLASKLYDARLAHACF
jgi:hypothetical protein